jgi:hypothetical protein
VTTVTDKPLDGNHLQKSDGGVCETAPSPQHFRHMSGLQVIHLAESAGVVLHLNGEGKLDWNFDRVKPGTDIDDLIRLLFVHDGEFDTSCGHVAARPYGGLRFEGDIEDGGNGRVMLD